MQGLGANVFSTFIFIVALFCDRTCRTPCDALSTGFISKEEAVFFWVAVFFLGGGQLEKGDNAPNSHSDSLRSDKTIA